MKLVTAILSLSCLAFAQTSPTLYEGARLIIGDSSPVIENGAFLVQNGRITAVATKGSIRTPRNAARVDLTGKTVMPAMINAHVHIGYEGFSAAGDENWAPENYSPENITDHLRRELYYGVSVTQTVGSSPTDSSLQFQKNQAAGKFGFASRFLFVPGMAPPNGGPDAILLRGTKVTRAVYEVSTATEARAAVKSMAAHHLPSVKIWVDDRRGTYPKMTPEVYNAVIDEAHHQHMIVQAHAIALEDQKAVVRAGADVLVHIVGNEKVDEELLSLVRQHKPYWTTVMGLSDRSEICDRDPLMDQTLPAKFVATVSAASCGPATPAYQTREAMLANNFPKMIAAGARLVLGTDAGISARSTFGIADHHEIARYVQLGITPADAIIAATSRPAELLGLKDKGSLKAGKSADFIVLTANPLENIKNSRKIEKVYLKGVPVDRDAMLAAWQKPR